MSTSEPVTNKLRRRYNTFCAINTETNLRVFLKKQLFNKPKKRDALDYNKYQPML